jgi:putative ABC transport system substrate-binding protein
MNIKKGTVVVTMLAALLAFVGVFGLVGCGSSSDAATTTASDTSESTSLKVCFVEIVENDAFITMMDGFKAEMEAKGYTDVTYDVKNAQGDSSTLNQIAASLKSSDYDVIVPIATPAAQACTNAGIDKPMVFMSVTDPIAAGITSTLESPDKGITGTSNTSDVAAIFAMGEDLDPTMYDKGVGIIYCTGETNAVVTAQAAKEYLEGKGITVTEKTVTNSSEVAQVATQLSSEVGCIYVPVDSVVQSAMAQLTSIATAAGVPVLGTDPVMPETGALLSVSCSNTTLGAESADLAIQLLNGADVSEVGIAVLGSDDYAYNSTTAEALGIVIPEGKGYRDVA